MREITTFINHHGIDVEEMLKKKDSFDRIQEQRFGELYHLCAELTIGELTVGFFSKHYTESLKDKEEEYGTNDQ